MKQTTQDALNKLSEAFGACMQDIGSDNTSEALANLLLLSTNSTGKSYKHDSVMGIVTVELNSTPTKQGTGIKH